jgi:hypothetical protein
LNIDITSPVVVSYGGTGVTSLTDHGVLVGSGTSPVTPLVVGTNGQVLIGAGGADPAFATITSSGGSILFAYGTNTLNMEVSPSFAWTDVTGTSQQTAVNNGYVSNNAALVTLTLPTIASFGTLLRVNGKGAGGWRIAQNASQAIYFGSAVTTRGVAGSVSSSNARDALELLCITTDTEWNVLSSVGNLGVS